MRVEAGQHRLSKRRHQRAEVFLGYRTDRTGDDVMDPKARFHRHYGAISRRRGPRHHVAFHAGPGQGGGQFAHVDIHAAAVAGTGLHKG